MICIPLSYCIAAGVIAYKKEPFFAGVMIGLVPMCIMMWVFDGLLKRMDKPVLEE